MHLAADVVVAERYRLVRRLGEGGMGAVWEAAHTITRGRVALKFLKGDGTPEMRRRFLREARAATLIRHPNVVTVRDVIEHDGTPVLVMDLLIGETLGARIARSGKLEIADVARIALAIVGAVGAAHAIGLVHRDLKPENIFLANIDGAEAVRVLDFGIAKVFGADVASTAMTESGAVLGTPVYMAPEQLFGERDLDHRIDVWSLGAMMFEMLTGRRPIEGENFGQIGKRMLADAIPSVAVERPDAPRALVELVDRMLRKERAERLDDLRLAADVLAPLATEPRPSFGAPVSPRPSSENDRVVVSSPRPADPVAETVAAPATGIAHVRSTSPSSRARWPWVLAAIVAAGGIGLTLRTRAPVAELPAASAQPDAPGVQPSPSAAPELPAPSVSTSVAPVASASPAPTKPASVKTTHVKTAASPSAAETAPAAAPSPSPSPSPSASLRGPAGLVTKPPF